MKSVLIFAISAFTLTFISGCTSVNGIAPIENSEDYYVLANKKGFLFIGSKPVLLRCKPDSEGNMKCKRVTFSVVPKETFSDE